MAQTGSTRDQALDKGPGHPSFIHSPPKDICPPPPTCACSPIPLGLLLLQVLDDVQQHSDGLLAGLQHPFQRLQLGLQVPLRPRRALSLRCSSVLVPRRRCRWPLGCDHQLQKVLDVAQRLRLLGGEAGLPVLGGLWRPPTQLSPGAGALQGRGQQLPVSLWSRLAVPGIGGPQPTADAITGVQTAKRSWCLLRCGG